MRSSWSYPVPDTCTLIAEVVVNFGLLLKRYDNTITINQVITAKILKIPKHLLSLGWGIRMNCLILTNSSDVLISGWIWMDLGKKRGSRCVGICPGEGLKIESLFIKQSVKRKPEGSPLQSKVLLLFSLCQCLQEQQRLQPHSTGAGGAAAEPPLLGEPTLQQSGQGWHRCCLRCSYFRLLQGIWSS